MLPWDCSARRGTPRGSRATRSATSWATATRYSPPNWSDFSFGVVRPYWMGDVGGPGFGRGVVSDGAFDQGPALGAPCCLPQPDQKSVTYTGVTDASGTHYLQLDFNGETPDLP